MIKATYWRCALGDRSRPCPSGPDEEFDPNEEFQPIETTKYIPEHTLDLPLFRSIYKGDIAGVDFSITYSLTLIVRSFGADEDNPWAEDYLFTCDIDLHIVDEERREPIELQINDTVPLIGFIDPFESHTFFCGPLDGQVNADTSQITYVMNILKFEEESLNADDAIASASNVQRTFDSLTVLPGDDFLEYDYHYLVECIAMNQDGTAYGKVQK